MKGNAAMGEPLVGNPRGPGNVAPHWHSEPVQSAAENPVGYAWVASLSSESENEEYMYMYDNNVKSLLFTDNVALDYYNNIKVYIT